MAVAGGSNGWVQRVGLWRMAGWGAAAALLLTPLAAMRFTGEVAWDGSDFAVAAALLATIGAAFELAAWKTRNLAYRLTIALALASAVVLIWAQGAVGIF